MKVLVERPRLAHWLWIGYWVVAFGLTHLPPTPGPPRPLPFLDKVAHLGLYFILTYLGAVRLASRTKPVTGSMIAFWAVVYLGYGIVDELTQPLTGRKSDMRDWLFDALGTAVASAVFWRRVRGSRSDPPSISQP